MLLRTSEEPCQLSGEQVATERNQVLKHWRTLLMVPICFLAIRSSYARRVVISVNCPRYCVIRDGFDSDALA